MATIINVHTGGFELGWDTFVALGTIGLAIFTALLAAKTRSLAKETTRLASETAADIAGQHRPILIPVSHPGQTPPLVIGDNGDRVFLTVRNVGTGPALAAVAVAEPGSTAPQPWQHAVIPVGQDPPLRLEFRAVPLQAGAKLIVNLTYTDIAGAEFGTRIAAGPTRIPGGGITYEIDGVHIRPSPADRPDR